MGTTVLDGKEMSMAPSRFFPRPWPKVGTIRSRLCP